MAEKLSCGDANSNGNVAIWYKGGCQKRLVMKDSYRCTGCGGWFHFDCIFNHFELERDHSRAHNALKVIEEKADCLSSDEIKALASAGLIREEPKTFFQKFANLNSQA